MKYHVFTIALISMLMLSASPATTAIELPPVTVTYDIISANTGNVTWFSPDYSSSYNYSFEGVDSIVVSMSNISTDAEFNITIGSFEQTNYPDSSIDGNLILSYWEVKYDLGLVANTTWDALNESAAGATYLVSMNVTEGQFSYMTNGFNITVDTVVIDIDAGAQQTYLVYEKNSGLLLEADTGFGNYFLHMRLSTLSSPLMSTSTTSTSDTVSSTTSTEETTTENTEDATQTSSADVPYPWIFAVLALVPIALIPRRKN